MTRKRKARTAHSRGSQGARPVAEVAQPLASFASPTPYFPADSQQAFRKCTVTFAPRPFFGSSAHKSRLPTSTTTSILSLSTGTPTSGIVAACLETRCGCNWRLPGGACAAETLIQLGRHVLSSTYTLPNLVVCCTRPRFPHDIAHKWHL